MRIYVGNLSYDTTQQELEKLFTQIGEVQQAFVVSDRATGRSKGFGFVEMLDAAQGEEAIRVLNSTSVDGRTIIVNQARARAEQPRTSLWNGPRRDQHERSNRRENTYR